MIAAAMLLMSRVPTSTVLLAFCAFALPAQAWDEVELLRRLDEPTQRVEALAELEKIYLAGKGAEPEAVKAKLWRWIIANSEQLDLAYSAQSVPSKGHQNLQMRWKAARILVLLGQNGIEYAAERYLSAAYLEANGDEGENLERGEILILKRHRPSDGFLLFVTKLVGAPNIIAARHALDVVIAWKRSGIDVKAVLDRIFKNRRDYGSWESLLQNALYLVAAHRDELARLTETSKPAFAPYVDYVAAMSEELAGNRTTPARLEIPTDVRATKLGVEPELVVGMLGRGESNVKATGLNLALNLSEWDLDVVVAVERALTDVTIDGAIVAKARARQAKEIGRLIGLLAERDPAARERCLLELTQ